MTVFKTFLKIINRKKVTIFLYTSITLLILVVNIISTNTEDKFEVKNPNIMVINNDEGSKLSEHFIRYLNKNANIEDYDNIEDALFYNQISYVVEIPKGFNSNIMSGKKATLNTTTANNSEAELSKLILNSYLRMANVNALIHEDEDGVIRGIDNVFENEVEASILDVKLSSGLKKAVAYFNIIHYSVIMSCVLVIAMVIMTFRKPEIHKRTIISSLSYRKFTSQLIISSGLYAFILWVIYSLLGFLFVGFENMWSVHGLLYLVNLFIFLVCILIISILITNLLKDKKAIDGVGNILGIGSSFLAGAFVPMEFLPESVLYFARILPSYWYIKTNNLLYDLKLINFESLKPILTNLIVLVGFAVVLLIINQILAKRRSLSI